MRWAPWLRRSRDRSQEARAALERAHRLDDDVARLGVALAEIRVRNHFSAAVTVAIQRSPREA